MKIKYFLISIVIILSSVVIPLFSITNVKAASEYDELLKQQQYPFDLQGYNVSSRSISNPAEVGSALAQAVVRGGYSCDSQARVQTILDGMNTKPYIVYTDNTNSGRKNIYLIVFNGLPTQYWAQDGVYISGLMDILQIENYNETQTTPLNCTENISHTFTLDSSPSWYNSRVIEIGGGFEFNYPPNYGGEVISDKTKIYPTFSLIVQDNGPDTDTSKVKLVLLDEWLEKYNLPQPQHVIFTLTDMNDEIIVADRCWGPTGCDWNELPLGDYKARLNVIYSDPSINDQYDFATTEAWFQVNNTSFTMLYNPNEGKFCTVKNGVEWNCSIPQPGDNPSVIDGEAEEWIPEDCDLANLGGCVRNILHYLGEYFGLNGSGITGSSSPFITFDTNTFGLTSVITAPLAMFNQLANEQYLCNPISLPLPHLNGTELELPCLYQFYEESFGQGFEVYQSIVAGVISYYIAVNMLATIKGFKDPKSDLIEVSKL